MTRDGLACPACGMANPHDRKFCTACGSELAGQPAAPIQIAEGRSNGGEGRKRFSWPIAISLFVVLAVLGAGIGYFAGSRGEDDSSPSGANGGQTAGAQTDQQELPRVLCRVGRFGSFRLTLKKQPRECEVLSEGAPIDADSTGTAVVLNLDWVEWGAEGAIANGDFFVSSAGPRPVTVRLSSPRAVCGSLVFTEFSATPADAESPTGRTLPIEGCLPGNSSPTASPGASATRAETGQDEFDTGDGPVAIVPPVAGGADAFIIKSWQTCPSGWEKRRSRNNQTGQVDTCCHRLGS